LLVPALADENLRRVTVAAHVMASGMGPRALNALGENLLTATGPRLAALLRGVETAALDGSFVAVANKLAQSGPAGCAALCQLKSFQRAAVGVELATAFQAEDAAHLGRALQAARFAGNEAARFVEAGMANKNAAVAVSAIESGLRLQLPAAWAAVRERARSPGVADAGLLRWAAALGGAEEFRAIIDATAREPLRAAALHALGHVGTVDAVETCLAHLADPKTARAAGEAYCAITGAELDRDRLALAETETDTPEFADEDLDANLVPQPQDLWPLPGAAAVRAHWDAVKARFEPGERYLSGQPRNAQSLMLAVANAPMLRRPDWVFELNARTARKYDVEPRAFRATQRRQLHAAVS
jgi:uncharacterized protein (TIGR02270 family)